MSAVTTTYEFDHFSVGDSADNDEEAEHEAVSRHHDDRIGISSRTMQAELPCHVARIVPQFVGCRLET